MIKKIVIVFAFLLLVACGGTKNLMDQNAGIDSQLEAAEEELLSVESVEDAQLKARKAIRENKLDLAQVYFVKAYGMEPDNISLLQEMAQLYKQMNKNEQAELCYQLILKQNPEDYKSIQQYGLFLIKLKKYPQAEEKLMQVLVAEGSVKNWQLLNGLGLVYDLQGQYGQAILYFKQALEISPDQIDVLNNMGYSLYRSEQYIEAIQYYKKVLAINPKYHQTLFNYALLEARLKNYNLARSIFFRLMSPSEANNNVGYIAMKNGDFELAGLFLQKALSLSSRHYEKAHKNLQMLKNLSKNKTSIYH